MNRNVRPSRFDYVGFHTELHRVVISFPRSTVARYSRGVGFPSDVQIYFIVWESYIERFPAKFFPRIRNNSPLRFASPCNDPAAARFRAKCPARHYAIINEVDRTWFA